ncbi:MAG: peptide-N-glycosidase F-related protein [Salinivirgaceae bacterium]|jgi:hypothetical protein|nr:peptide-N-glycosidase F-related protein [Salinivirgaceae bacterium]
MRTKSTLLFICLFLCSAILVGQNFALQFDGTDDKIGVADSPELNPETGLTLELWINAQEWAGSIWGANLISKQGTGPNKGYGLTVGENGRIEFNHSINESWNAVQTSPILGLNSWYHIAAVYDLNTMKIYVNGILQSTANAQGTPTLGEGQVMNIGDNPTWPGRFFNGKMDEIRIWNVARTETEIQESMSTELDGTESGLVAYWNMNEGTGTSIADGSANENTGTLLGMDETAWVEGFTPPGTDIGVVGIASPSFVGSGFTTEEHISVDVKNFATNDVEEFTIFYAVNDGDPVSEVVQQNIPAFTEKVITLTETVDLSGYDEIELSVWVELEGDGNTVNDLLVETISQTNQFMLYDGVQHNFSSAGQTHFRTVYMPEDLSHYESIVLHLDLECPSGGCDPWDQPGMLYINKDNMAWEIARYVTPYGKACGGWSYDLTDFKPILEGKTVFESIIRVWGASGWLVNMELELTPGEPEYHVTKIDRLWNEDYWVYGDPDISYDFDPVAVPILENTDAAQVRMAVTGHGQGNTLNAAEFSHFTHNIHVNGNEEFPMDLWKDDCDENDCSNQSGTWLYSRAGWCPGQNVVPWLFNLEGLFTQGQDLELDFVLADYTNELNTGYNNNGHTEPHCRIHGYLVQYEENEDYNSIEQSVTVDEGTLRVAPNPSKGMFTISSETSNIQNVAVYRIDGCRIKNYRTGEVHTFELNMEHHKQGVYFLNVQTDQGVEIVKIIKN